MYEFHTLCQSSRIRPTPEKFRKCFMNEYVEGDNSLERCKAMGELLRDSHATLCLYTQRSLDQTERCACAEHASHGGNGLG